jgi:membrane protease YdiL (CAAX protease family)
VTTVAAGNLLLVVAALVLGLVVGLERRASGGILGPAITHVTWALAMLFGLPLVFG